MLAGIGGQSAVTPEDVATALDVLASRMRRMPHGSFHAQRSVIAQDLAELARRIAPRARRTSELEVELSERRRGRIVVATTQAINGRRIWSRSAVRSRFTLVNHQ